MQIFFMITLSYLIDRLLSLAEGGVVVTFEKTV